MSLFGDHLRRIAEGGRKSSIYDSEEIDLLADLKLLVHCDTFIFRLLLVLASECGFNLRADTQVWGAILARVKAMKYKEVAELLEQKFRRW